MTEDASATCPTRASAVASIGGYLAILFVTVVATGMIIGTALAENSPPGDTAHSAITIAVFAAILVAAIAAACLTQTKSPANYWFLLPALLVAIALTLLVVLLAYNGTSQAVDYWRDPNHIGDAGSTQWRLAALIAFACPFVAVILTGFQRGAGRIFLVATALASFSWLAMMAFDQVARTNL